MLLLASAPTVTVYEKNGVTLTLSCERQSESGLTVTLTASNSTDSDISSFTLQAAVPKVCNKHPVYPPELTAVKPPSNCISYDNVEFGDKCTIQCYSEEYSRSNSSRVLMTLMKYLGTR